MRKYTHPGDWCTLVSGIRYVSTEALVWAIGTEGSGLIVTIPEGVTFDVSIPCGLRWLFDPHDGRYLKAAALHDELLRKGWHRITAAAIFHEALQADGVSAWRRLVMWLAVSLFKYQ